MKLVELQIQGFRSLKEVIWKPGDLNLIIGPNGSGKSNLLKALEMVSISARGGLNNQVLREGGMGSLVWDGQAEKISFALRLHPSREADRSWLGDRMEYSLQLARLGQSSSYVIHKETLGNPASENEQEINLLHRDQNSAKIRNGAEWKSINPELTESETLLSWYATPFAESDVLRIGCEQLASWQIYHQFNTQRDTPARQAPMARVEKVVSPDGANLVQVLHTLYTGDRLFKEDLNLAMNAAFGGEFIELVFPPASDQRIQMRIRWKSLLSEQSAADISEGTLRFLYLIAILANPTPPALIAIDEPENGLHPAMLPIIAEYTRSASRRTQVIITTHSAELLDAFSEYEPTVTVAKWVEGQSILNIVTKSQLDYWLQDYSLGKLFRSGSLEDME